jgi:hypothetical protein
MTLQQSMDRALRGGTIIAELNYSSNKYITIRAHQGLSFHGEIRTIDGDIDLFTLFGRLSVSGGLKSSGKIKLIALEGSLDLSATCNAISLITYSKGDLYIHDIQVNAMEFLSSTVGRYTMANSVINASKTVILSEDDALMVRASRLNTTMLSATSKGDVRLEASNIDSTDQNYIGRNIDVQNSNISGGDSLFNAQGNIIISHSTIDGNNISSDAGRAVRYVFSQVSANYIVNESGGDISIRASNLYASRVRNRASNGIEIAGDSEIVSSLLTNYSGGNTEIIDSSIYSSQMIFNSQKKITIDSSLILSDNNIFFQAVSNYLAVNSNIFLTQYPNKLFLHKTGVDSEGNPLMRCGFSLKGIEAIGMLGSKGYNQSFADFQYALVNSSKIDLGIFAYLAGDNPKAIIIDAASGIIMGSQLNAANHHVIIKASHGIELLPLCIYNLAMFSGGITKESVATVISKIEAGLINLDGGTLVKSVGALMRASTGNLKADYIVNESLLTKIAAKQRSLAELALWINGADDSYDTNCNN